MSDNSLVVAALKGLTDQELIAIIRAVSENRPGLDAVHAAAVAFTEGTSTPAIPGLPDVPQTPSIPQTPAVPPTHEIPGSTPEVPPPAVMGSGTAQSVPTVPEPDYTAGGVPTFDRVRDKVEERLGTALGSEELDRETPAGRSLQEQWSAREEAGHKKLDEIRKSLHSTGADDQDGTTKGTE